LTEDLLNEQCSVLLQEELGLPDPTDYPIPKDTIMVLRKYVPGNPEHPTDVGVLVKLTAPIKDKDQEYATIHAKSVTRDHSFKTFSITFGTNHLSNPVPLVCRVSWLVPLEEWVLNVSPPDTFYGIPPSGKGVPLALWWGRSKVIKDKPTEDKWYRVGDTFTVHLPGADYVEHYDDIHMICAGIVPIDGQESGYGEQGHKFQVSLGDLFADLTT
jgi:hypothetical protein